ETAHGRMRLYVYADRIGQETHLALVKGEPAPDRDVLVRVHEPISLMDMLDVQSTTHSWNFNDALATIARADCGVIELLHRQETAEALLERARSQPGEAAAVTPAALR